jgi:hypothetical protein
MESVSLVFILSMIEEFLPHQDRDPRKYILESYIEFRNIPPSNPALSLVFILSTTKRIPMLRYRIRAEPILESYHSLEIYQEEMED